MVRWYTKVSILEVEKAPCSILGHLQSYESNIVTPGLLTLSAVTECCFLLFCCRFPSGRHSAVWNQGHLDVVCAPPLQGEPHPGPSGHWGSGECRKGIFFDWNRVYIYIYIYIYSHYFQLGCYNILNIIPCLYNKPLLLIYFMYSSLYLLILYS